MDLESHKFISFFEPEQAAELCRIAIIENFSQNKVLFDEGEPSDCLYLVLAGQVEFRKYVGSNQYQTLTKALPNSFFGELGILDGQPRSAQAIICEDATLAKIPGYSLMKILENTKGSVAINLFSYAIQRLRESTDEYVKQVVYKEKMVLLGEMLNTVIHDFKSPLSGINLASGMVKELHPDEETIEWCNLIQAQAQRMLAMAEEFLEFVRGNSVLNKKPINLAEALHRFEKLNRVYFKEAEVEFVMQAADMVVNADENKLMRVVQNLVSNAVEAFKGCGGRVELTAWMSEQGAHINIHDNGPGIPEAIRERLFEAFVTYGKHSGTGLGTAIAKSIIEAHGGQISFQSSCQEGTTFYISLPLSTNLKIGSGE
ncbi:MAG: cyclic nucleotide-binding domain-containing protein [Coleofasciculus sp. Co-bin14]|nr:cyclic nucleotide-binding domain-containing protein [Coleofasciculus sp. Co-bin14]